MFNGIRNYQIVLSDPKFHKAILNTTLYSFTVVPVGVIIAMIISLIIFEKIKHKDIFETIFFIPYLTSIIAVGIVFRFLLNNFTDTKYVNNGFSGPYYFAQAGINFLFGVSLKLK